MKKLITFFNSLNCGLTPNIKIGIRSLEFRDFGETLKYEYLN